MGRNLVELSLLWSLHVILATAVLLPGTPLDTLRSVVAFVYLLVVPGLLLVRLLRVYQEDSLAQLVTAVGLSLVYDMVLGLVLSGIPSAMIERPLEAEVFLPSSLVITAALSLGVRTERSLLAPFGQFARPSSLAWALLPLSAVFAALHVQEGEVTLWMVIILSVIAATPLLLLVRRPTAAECVLALFSIALALALHKYFAAPLVHGGGDIRREIFIASQVLDAGRWSPDASHLYGAMLSVTALPTAVSGSLGLDLITTFKIFYAIPLAVIPVTIFLILRSSFSIRWALVAALLYLGNFTFGAMPSLNKQVIATLLVALLILTITSNERGPMRVRLLQLGLALSVVFSHYTTVPILVIAFGTGLLLGRFVQRRVSLTSNQIAVLPSVGLILAVLVFTYVWFTWTLRGDLFNTFVHIGARFLEAIADGLLFNRQATSISTGTIPDGISYMALLLANWALVFSSLLGLAVCIHGILRKDSFRTNLAVLGSGGIMIGGIFLFIPQPIESLSTYRAFFMSLLWLLPLVIYGMKWAIGALGLVRKKIQPYLVATGSLALSIYIALGTGLVTHLVGDEDFSYALDSRLTANSHDDAALQFISFFGVEETKIYTDYRGQDYLFLIAHEKRVVFLSNLGLLSSLPDRFYLYLRRPNLAGEWVISPYSLGEMGSEAKKKTEPEMVQAVASLRQDLNQVYDSGGATLDYGVFQSMPKEDQ
jgi:uncharacterized membrane protein